jgi:hypothetical protein
MPQTYERPHAGAGRAIALPGRSRDEFSLNCFRVQLIAARFDLPIPVAQVIAANAFEESRA